METRMFDRPATVLSSDLTHWAAFNPGDRVKNVRRIGSRVMFEPIDAHHIAGTYEMDWAEFEAQTTTGRGAGA